MGHSSSMATASHSNEGASQGDIGQVLLAVATSIIARAGETDYVFYTTVVTQILGVVLFDSLQVVLPSRWLLPVGKVSPDEPGGMSLFWNWLSSVVVLFVTNRLAAPLLIFSTSVWDGRVSSLSSQCLQLLLVYEVAYMNLHYLCHQTTWGWAIHKTHHQLLRPASAHSGLINSPLDSIVIMAPPLIIGAAIARPCALALVLTVAVETLLVLIIHTRIPFQIVTKHHDHHMTGRSKSFGLWNVCSLSQGRIAMAAYLLMRLIYTVS